jgi:hypothetical protein
LVALLGERRLLAALAPRFCVQPETERCTQTMMPSKMKAPVDARSRTYAADVTRDTSRPRSVSRAALAAAACALAAACTTPPLPEPPAPPTPRELAERQLETVGEHVAACLRAGMDVDSLAQLETLESGLSPQDRVDPWNRELRLGTIPSSHGTFVKVFSNGADGEPRTEDDLTYLTSTARRGSLGGRIVDGSGRPLAGVTITSMWCYMPGAFAGPPPPVTERRVTTSADGTFALTEIVPSASSGPTTSRGTGWATRFARRTGPTSAMWCSSTASKCTAWCSSMVLRRRAHT